MGLLTELFIASEDEAKAYNADTYGRFPGAQLGGLTSLEFETLWAILSNEPWSPETHSLDHVASDEESWTFRFPTAYLEKLQRLEPEGIATAAASWAKTDEMACTPSEAERAITTLVSVAKSVVGPDKALFFWGSL